MSNKFRDINDLNVSNQLMFKQLSPEDIQFYELISNRITSSNALPFDLPAISVFNIIRRSMKWFWEWYPNALEEMQLLLPLEEIRKNQNGLNIDIKLPNGIEAVFDWRGVESATLGRNVTSYINYAMLNNFQITSLASGSTQTRNNTYGGLYKNEPFSMSSIMTSLFEVEQYREIFKRNYRCTFNKNTGIFRIMTSIDSPLVLSCFVRIPPSDMYNDITFEDYVVYSIEEQLGKILSAFDAKLIGDIQINFAEVKDSGKDGREKIEDEIKDSNVADMMLSK